MLTGNAANVTTTSTGATQRINGELNASRPKKNYFSLQEYESNWQERLCMSIVVRRNTLV